MAKSIVENAQIVGTHLGDDGRGLLTACIHVDYGSARQGFGHYYFGGMSEKVEKAWGIEFVRMVLWVVGVNKWEDLVGRYVRVECKDGLIRRIGNILKDNWFDPKALAENEEE